MQNITEDFREVRSNLFNESHTLPKEVNEFVFFTLPFYFPIRVQFATKASHIKLFSMFEFRATRLR